jgi:zinc transport system substrate-binding protein
MVKAIRPLALFAAIVASGCSAGGSGETESVVDSRGLHVFVSIPPQAYFVNRIAGSLAAVSVLVPDGKSPHTYEPTPRQVIDLSGADIYFSIGVDFERAFLPRIRDSLPDLTISDSRAGIALRSVDGDDHDGEDHDDIDGDPHVWLGLDEVERIAVNIRDALISADPANSDAYTKGCEALLRDVESMRTELLEKLAGSAGQLLFVYHPSFGYFADEFGLVQKAVETGGNQPSPRQLERMIDEAKAKKIAAVVVQPQFSTAGADRIADAIGAKVVAVDPLSDDWLATMRLLADAVGSP